MKDLKKLYKEVLKDFDALGIKYGKIVEVVPNYRAKSRWGQCKKRPDGFYININVALLADNISDQGAKETIAHEICHTIKGCMNHGTEWKHYAQMLKARGYNIKRTNSAEDKGIHADAYSTPTNYKYEVYCAKCGTTSRYQRKGKVITTLTTQKYHGYRCGECGSHNLKVRELKAYIEI